MRWAVVSIAAALAVSACKRGQPSASADAGADAAAAVEPQQGQASVATPPPPDKPLLGITAFVATVYKEPRDTSKKLGYLRVGARVARSAEPAGKQGCPGGWYEIHPRGFVCGDDATTDLDAPILKAAAKGPDRKAAMPYRYGFVRAVLPLYVRVPTADEQYKSEFKLKEHLDWYRENELEVSKVVLGAHDVPLDDRGIPIPNKQLGELGQHKNSLEIGLGALLGGETNDDPIPFWLADGRRLVPNISDFQVPDYAVFADRARRHTGLAFVGSFATGPESLNRRFGITTDLRLAPATKIKPDTGSPWHGVELGGALTLPLAFVRVQGARAYKIHKGKVAAAGELEHRSVVGLNGKMRTVEGVKYYRTTDKRWLHQQDVGLAVAPSAWPEAADKGEKWIEVSIGNQTLVLWEGKKPVYATLVSSGKAGIDDWKKTTATIRGSFRIRNKHLTATMDSNESSAVGGSRPEGALRADNEARSDDDDEGASRKPKPAAAPAAKPDPKKPSSAAAPKGKTASKDGKGNGAAAGKKGDGKGKAPAAAAAKAPAKEKDPPVKAKSGGDKGGDSAPESEYVPRKGDGLYGVSKRRGEGTFVLRDVPYIQYFAQGYALHAAYWHDVFGTPRSHGCINLSPVDAHFLFGWTEPALPEGWHAMNTGEEFGEGTVVIVHE